MALYFSRDLVKTLQDTVFYDSLESLFKKIKTTLPPDSEEFLKNVQNTLYVSQKQYKEYGRAKGSINTVNDAAIKKRSIEINYYSMSHKKESVRKVDPYRILFFNGTFYLIAYCHQRIETRIFALDRIKSVSMTGESFTVPDDFDLEDFMKPSFGIFKGKPEKVRIWFGPNAAGYITEKVWHETQNIIETDDGSIIFEAEIAITEEIKTWVLSWGSKAAVLKPASLKKELKDEIEKMARKY
jgi:predicted DNA-binding transcriptional regulator YafY